MSRMVVLPESELRRMLDEAVERGANLVKEGFRNSTINLGNRMARRYRNTLYENYVPRYESSDSGGCGSSDSGGCGSSSRNYNSGGCGGTSDGGC